MVIIFYIQLVFCRDFVFIQDHLKNQRTNGPVNAHLISWPTKAQKFAKNDALQSQ